MRFLIERSEDMPLFSDSRYMWHFRRFCIVCLKLKEESQLDVYDKVRIQGIRDLV